MNNEKTQNLATERQPVSHEILERMNNIAELSRDISDKVNDRLTPIMRDEPGQEDIPETPEQAYPPLFITMRTQLKIIESSLLSIGLDISKVEI